MSWCWSRPSSARVTLEQFRVTHELPWVTHEYQHWRKIFNMLKIFSKLPRVCRLFLAFLTSLFWVCKSYAWVYYDFFTSTCFRYSEVTRHQFDNAGPECISGYGYSRHRMRGNGVSGSRMWSCLNIAYTEWLLVLEPRQGLHHLPTEIQVNVIWELVDTLHILSDCLYWNPGWSYVTYQLKNKCVYIDHLILIFTHHNIEQDIKRHPTSQSICRSINQSKNKSINLALTTSSECLAVLPLDGIMLNRYKDGAQTLTWMNNNHEWWDNCHQDR